jgi:protein-tyrosine phosphatase
MIAGKREVPAIGGAFDDIFDCTVEGESHEHQAKVLHVPPTDTHSHRWTEDDLDVISELVMGCLEQDRRVLIHCGRGVSRSTCAAAAVLLSMGRATEVEQAVEMVRDSKRAPVNTALASLKRWWANRRQLKLC